MKRPFDSLAAGRIDVRDHFGAIPVNHAARAANSGSRLTVSAG